MVEKWKEKGHFTPSKERKIKAVKNTEGLPALEKEWETEFAGMIFTGVSGTGKTDTLNGIAEVLKHMEIFKFGEVLRRKKGAEATSKFIKRGIEEDQEIDSEQKRLIIKSTRKKPIGIDSWFGAFLASKHRNENPEPVIVIKFTVEEEERFKRLQKRHKKRGNDFTIEEIKIDEEEKVKENRLQWIKAHPEYPELATIDPNDDKFADFIIDTTDKSVREVINELLVMLEKTGFIKPKTPDGKNPDLNMPKISRADDKEDKKEEFAKKGTIFRAKGKGRDLDDIIGKTSQQNSEFTLPEATL